MKRSIWYSFSTPNFTATTATVSPAAPIAASHRRGAPEAAMTPKTVASRTSRVPRSGWSRIMTAGTAATASIARTSTCLTSRCRHEPSVRSATTSAIPVQTASLANSAGWIDIPPSMIQLREPLIVVPMTSTSSRPTSEAT